MKHIRLMLSAQRDPSRLFIGYFNSFLQQLQRNQTSTSGCTIFSEPIWLPSLEDVWLHLKTPFIYSVHYDNSLYNYHSYYNFYPADSSFFQSYNYLVKPSNRYYLSEHTNKRPWKSNEYLTGAAEEELINCPK